MTETGVVTEVKNGYAKVRVEKKEECAKCGMCLFKDNVSYTEFSARDKIGASVGDTVEAEIGGSGRLLSCILVFLVPLILVACAALIGEFLINSEIWIAILSVVSVVLWYTILAAIDKKFGRSEKFCPKILRITEKGGK